MLWVLIQNAQTLRITERQLECTIDPVLEPRMFGSTLRLTNEGSISLNNIEETAIILAYYELNKGISIYRIIRPEKTICKEMITGDSLNLDLFEYVDFLTPDKPENSISAFAYIITYRRAADMKPYEKFIPFLVSTGAQEDSSRLFLPLFSNIGMGESGSFRFLKVDNEEIRSALLDIYKERIASVELHRLVSLIKPSEGQLVAQPPLRGCRRRIF